jgi:hypothetical protein
MVPLFPARRAFRGPTGPFEVAKAGHRLSPHELTPLPGFLSGLPAGLFSLICPSLLKVPEHLLPEQPGPVARELRRGSGTSKTWPPPARLT